MPTRTINTEGDRAAILTLLGGLNLPFSVEWLKGRKRSTEQNKLQRKWMGEIADQLGEHTAEEIRGFCKLHFGVPILRAEDDVFREKYDAIVRPMPYEQKLLIMQVPLDLPVTRDMTTDQKTRYLDAVYKHFSERGVILTLPQSEAA